VEYLIRVMDVQTGAEWCVQRRFKVMRVEEMLMWVEEMLMAFNHVCRRMDRRVDA
jgi:hypothetical protein